MKQKLLVTSVLAASLTTPTLVVAANPGVPAGAVYAMTNDVDTNEVVAYDRAADGKLTFSATYSTGGQGGFAGDPADALGSEGALVLSQDKNWLYAANAGSNQISVFRVLPQGLDRAQILYSGGDFPVSITQYQDLVYVLNSGGDGNITGFTVEASGRLTPIPGSTRSLEAGGSNPPEFVKSPAQVSFDPTGHWLVVTLKELNQIDVFAVDESGVPSAEPVVNPSSGSTPFGFGFDAAGHLIVAEPFGPAEPGVGGSGAVSSYSVDDDGRLVPISATVENFQTATCWIVLGARDRFAYASNNLTNSITGYRVNPDGSLEILDPDGFTAASDTRPVDIVVTPNGHFLYSLNAGTGTVAVYGIDADTGALTFRGDVDGLPEDNGAAGLAVR